MRERGGTLTVEEPEAGEETVAVARKEFLRKRRRQRWRRARRWLLALLVLAVVAGSGWLLYFSHYVTVERVQVTGTHRVPAFQVRRAAAVPMGRQLARVDLAAIQARVESVNAIRSASVSRSWPHGITVSVVERQPVAVVDRGSVLQAVDEAGVLFGSYRQRPAGLPLIRTQFDASTEALAEGGHVAAALPADLARRVDHLSLATVDQIELVLRDGRRIVWGSAAQSGQKAQVAAVLLHRKVQVIDVSVPERPTTRG